LERIFPWRLSYIRISPVKERYLLIRLSALGDVIHALAAHRLLRIERPDATIDWLVEDRFVPLLERVDGIDDIVVFPRKQLRRPSPAGVASFFRHARSIVGSRYDVAIDLHGNLKSGMHLRAARARRRIGLGPDASKEGAHRFANEHVRPLRGCHRVRRGLELLAPLGIDGRRRVTRDGVVDRDLWPIFLDDPELDARATERVPDEPAPRILIHPGTSVFGAFKRLPPRTFGAVAASLIDRLGARCYVTFGPGEQELAEGVVRATAAALGRDPNGPEPGCQILEPDGGMRGLIASLKRADLLIAADSGPLLLASALGRKTVALFGPKDPDVYAPPFAESAIVVHDIPCRPCSLRRCSDPECMIGMRAEAIVSAATSLLRPAPLP